ncbi:MAG: (2Fe-2S)-binding protein [Nitrospinae bacterium]|nr:(2Fe-2S)-binding protein [Nitrospinota bacterium]
MIPKVDIPQADEIVCKCLQIPESVIRNCIEENGLTEIEQVTRACQAGGGCHTCHMLIQLFIDQNRERNRPTEEPVSAHPAKVLKKGIFARFFSRNGSKTPSA